MTSKTSDWSAGGREDAPVRRVWENLTMKMWVEVFKGNQSSHFEVVSYTVHADALLELTAPDGSVQSFQVGEYTNFEARQ
jgi:hypothetical protein